MYGKITLLFIFIVVSSFSVKAESVTQEIDALVKAYSELNKFNGTVLVARNNKMIYTKAFGYQDVKNRKPNTPESLFQIGSLTKPFTALIILKLVEEKKLSLNDKVGKFIPEYKNGRDITIGQLLNHTAGGYEIFRNQSFFESLSNNLPLNNEKKLSYFINEPLDFPPGTKFSYSNSGYILLGVIIEKVTASTFEKALEKYVLKPAKMKNSGFNYAELVSPRKTVGYAYLSASKQIEASVWNSSTSFSSGAMFSDVSDLYKWNLALNQNKIISKEMSEKSVTPVLDSYGYGWFIDKVFGKKVINHGGNVEGSTSYFARIPEDGVCVILLNNITNTQIESVGKSILAILYQKPYKMPKPKQEIDLAEDILNSYIGNYDVSSDYRVSVTREANGLYFQVNDEKKIRIYPEKKDSFFIKGEDIEIKFNLKNEGGKPQIIILQGLSRKIGDKVE